MHLRRWWRRACTNEALLVLGSVALVCALLLFVELADEVNEREHLPLENRIMHAFRTGEPPRPIGPHWVAEAARDITALGSVAVLSGAVILAAGYLLLCGRRAAALFVAVASLGGLGLNTALKYGFERERPEVSLRLIEIDSFSFPSGHAMSSATIYLTLAVLLSQLTPHRRRKFYIFGAAAALAFVVGLSRVYLGVHYPTDVVAGWAAGGAWALICWLAAHLLGRRNLRRADPRADLSSCVETTSRLDPRSRPSR
jgi:undecaprenyl-diphosphatase